MPNMVDGWTHAQLQSDLYQRRRNRKGTIAWSEVEIPGTKGGRFDVYEARHHDGRAQTSFVGFEVKASMRDLESDLSTGKWKRYLPACDQMLFAMPKDLCDPASIPEPAGIIWRTGNRLDGRWQMGRKPQTGHRTVTDLDVWRRLAMRQYWTPITPQRSRLERMHDYTEMRDLSRELSARFWSTIQTERSRLLADRNRYEQTERRIADLEALQERLADVPELLAAVGQVLQVASRRVDPTYGRSSTLEEALVLLGGAG